VLEDVNKWDESEATVANLYLDTVSDSVVLEYVNVEMDVDVANSLVDNMGIGDMIVDEVKEEVDESDTDVVHCSTKYQNKP
jgi:hypothetical protein